jgi:hypothetical protein
VRGLDHRSNPSPLRRDSYAAAQAEMVAVASQAQEMDFLNSCTEAAIF